MSWLKKLFGASSPRPASAVSFPVVVELLPGALSAKVYAHELDAEQGPIRCWSYVSDGLSDQRQEVVITLRREASERLDQFPEDPLRLFASLHRQGLRVEPGGFTVFGGDRFFGHHLYYERALVLPGVPLPPSCAVALMVNDEELHAVREFGATRVLARMGKAATYYPFPPWVERWRHGLSFEGIFEASLLAKVPRFSGAGARVRMEDGRITTTVLRSAQSRWREAMVQARDDAALAVLTEPDPQADGCLVWEPGQEEPLAITPPGSTGVRLCGCFLLIAPDSPADSGRPIEDGYLLQLTYASWAALRAAAVEGAELAIPLTGAAKSFALTWEDVRYVSPVDGKAYFTEGGWRTYSPRGHAEPAPLRGGLACEGVRLSTLETEFEGRTSARDLGAFVVAISQAAASTLRGAEFKVRVRMTCSPSGHRAELAVQGEVSREALQALQDALDALPRLPVREGEVVFEVGFSQPPSA